MSQRFMPLRRAWWWVHHRRAYRLSYMSPKVHVCWWGATLGPWRGYYVVLNWHAFDGPSAYISPNATPWHHAARSLFTFKLMSSRCSQEAADV